MRSEPWDDAILRFVPLVEEIEAGHGPVILRREGRPDLALLLAEDLTSLMETLLWQAEALERAAAGEPVGAGEDGPGLTEAEVRFRYGPLLQADQPPT